MAGLSYEDLFQIYRSEKSSNALGELTEDFDDSLLSFLMALSQRAQEEPNAQKELENAKKIAIGLISIRRQKIIMRSIMGQDRKEGLLEREKIFFDRIKGICTEEDAWINSVVTAKKKMDGNGKDLKKLKIISEVPAYRGADLREYGPFIAGQEVELPKKEAEWMIAGRLAMEA